MADASNPTTWVALTSMPSTRFFVGIIDLWDGFIVAGGMQGSSVATAYATAYKYTLTPSITQTTGDVVCNAVNLSLIQKIEDCIVVANIPAATSIKSAVSIDGVWYSYDGNNLVAQPSKSDALAAGSALSAVTPNQYRVSGLSGKAVNNSELKIALLLTGSASATPEVYAVKYNLLTRDTYSPVMITSFVSPYGDIGLRYTQGDYSSTNVKNKTASPMTLVLKVYDGAIAS